MQHEVNLALPHAAVAVPFAVYSGVIAKRCLLLEEQACIEENIVGASTHDENLWYKFMVEGQLQQDGNTTYRR